MATPKKIIVPKALVKPRRRKRRVRIRGVYISTKMGVSMTFRSGWEFLYFKYLDAQPEVLQFWSESLKIPYATSRKTGRLRNYIPDLLIEYADRKLLVEIKPKSKVSRPINIKKFNAARLWCTVNAATFIVITEIELKALGLMK